MKTADQSEARGTRITADHSRGDGARITADSLRFTRRELARILLGSKSVPGVRENPRPVSNLEIREDPRLVKDREMRENPRPVIEESAVEVERYELSAPPSYTFAFERRDFLRVLGTMGGGLLVCAYVTPAGAQESGRGAQRGAVPRELSAWLHIDEDGSRHRLHRQDRNRSEHSHVAGPSHRRRAPRAARIGDDA